MTYKRECGSCTKCCEGYLQGSVQNKSFYLGKPCHFVTIGKGCTIYAQRPKEPCVAYKCEWLVNLDMPEWLKPDLVNAIIDYRYTKNDILYLNVVEAGETLRSQVLSYIIQYALNNQLNIAWEIEGGKNWLGTEEFAQEMASTQQFT